MNPYDFARIDWNRPPERRVPIWHHQLTSRAGKPLYSGSLEVEVYAETPIFVADPKNVSDDPRKPAQSMQNQQGDFIIPGSSLKGMIRNVVETLGNGCLTLFDGEYESGRVDYRRKVPGPFQHCDTNARLCIACRLFGMLEHRASGVFLGKVNIGDAVALPEKVYRYEPMYTAVLVEPKPRHAAFYLDENREHISGRKFYFHHSPELKPLTANTLIWMGGRPANRYIQPLDYDTQFRFRVDFTALEEDEFGALLFAVALEEQMRHKIGYGKPLGLGSVSLQPMKLTLIDYAARYRAGGDGRGKTVLEGNAMWQTLYKHMDAFTQQHVVSIALDDLRRIWRWKPEPGVEYRYPSKRDWFDTEASRGVRIAGTRNVP